MKVGFDCKVTVMAHKRLEIRIDGTEGIVIAFNGTEEGFNISFWSLSHPINARVSCLGYRYPYIPGEFTLPKLWIKRRAFGEVHCAQIGLKEEHLVRFIT